MAQPSDDTTLNRSPSISPAPHAGGGPSAYLVVISGPSFGEMYKLKGERSTLGRGDRTEQPSSRDYRNPRIRWFPADEAYRDKRADQLMPPLVSALRKKVKECRASGYDDATPTSKRAR